MLHRHLVPAAPGSTEAPRVCSQLLINPASDAAQSCKTSSPMQQCSDAWSMHLCNALARCTCTMHLHDALALCTCKMCLYNALAWCSSTMAILALPKPKLNVPSQCYTTTITLPGDVLGSRFGAASAVPGLTVGSSSARIIKNSISGRHVRRFSPQGHLIQM